MNIFEILKTFNKNDLKVIAKPLFFLFTFVFIVFFLFPKPSRIYKDYVLKECKCLGIKAVPSSTKGSSVGDEYCLGIPISCNEQLLRGELDD